MTDKYTILIINDDLDQLELLETLLRKTGYKTLTAPDGKMGFEIARRNQPDLIISDVMMPGVDGIELCRMVRADSKLHLTPILLVSALRKDTTSIVKGLENGADDYVEVPYEPTRLIAKTARLIERKQKDDALRETENRFRTLIENATDVISILTHDGTIVYESPSIENVLGYEPDELIGQNAFELIHPADANNVAEFFQRAISRPSASQPIEYRFRHKDNSWRVLESVGKQFHDPDKGLVGIVNSRDITERKRALEAQRESELRYRNFIRQTSEGIWRIEFSEPISIDIPIDEQIERAMSDGYYAECNEAMAQMYGYESAQDLIGKHFSELLVLSDETNLNLIRVFFENGYQLADAETRELDVGGNEKYFLNNFLGIISDGKLTDIWGAQRDITRQKEADLALRESENRFRLVLRATNDAIWDWDLQTGALWWNENHYLIFGYPIGELEPSFKLWEAGIHVNDKERIVKSIENAIENREIYWIDEYRYRRADGSFAYILDRGYLLYGGDGKPVRMIGAMMDITDRKQSEAALTEANERAIREYDRLLGRLTALAQTTGAARDLLTIYRAIRDFTLASMPCSAIFISLYDAAHSSRKGVYLWFNGEEEDVSNLSPVHVGEGSVGRAVKTGEVVIIDDYLSAAGRKPTHVYLGYEDDPRDPHSTLIAPMKIKADVIGTIEVQSYEAAAYRQEHATAMQMAANIIANAIENVRLLEQERENGEQLRQAQKLESVGRLAGGIAHDFNNMLTAINGYSELALRRLSGDDNLRIFIEEIRKAGERSASLTHQLLAFSRQQVLQPKVLVLNEIISDTSNLLQRLIGEDIQLKILPNPKMGSVQADPGQLTQVIMNLAVNARDAMPKGGQLTIETKNVYLDEEYAARHISVKPGNYVLLAVSDTGEGIDQETQQHIFEPFYTTKGVGKGTGLGLATVYGIVKQSGGYIWVYSELGEGTTFKIYLPRVDVKADATESGKAHPELPTGSETILLVEDEEMVRNLSRKILENCGYQVIEARNGNEALSIFRKSREKIDLLLTDVVMPEMGGRELAEKIRQIDPQIRLLYVSGYTDDTVIRQGMVREETNFIQKPFNFDELARKVRSLLDGKNERKSLSSAK